MYVRKQLCFMISTPGKLTRQMSRNGRGPSENFKTAVGT